MTDAVMQATAPVAVAVPNTEMVPWTRIGFTLYEVSAEDEVIGYVEVVGPVFVALMGVPYDHATEVEQRLDFQTAVNAVLRRARA